jgi:5-methylcytosine-specific restriction protein A
MGRLKALRSTVAPLAPRVGFIQGDEKAQDKSRNMMAPWRAWYKTARWTSLRKVILVRDLYTCHMCGRIAYKGMVVDHKVPHRGNEARFWDENNLQVLCQTCHSGEKQRQEQSTPTGVWD